MPAEISGNNRIKLRRRLLAWYAKNARDLPWRRTRDPYAIWISEIMLQQTRVETVIAYYNRFIKRFPDVHSLARAREHSVLKMWEGLGYYSRARNLHKAAKTIAKNHNGELPNSASELLKLPGIGKYTAGAIASIAFGADEPLVDGNVSRVFCRLFRFMQPPKTIESKLWDVAHSLLPKNKTGDFNQALMELGATVCTPKNPACGKCPLAKLCRAKKHGEQLLLPTKNATGEIPHKHITVAILIDGDNVLIRKRPTNGLLGGLWEFPNFETQDKPSEKNQLRTFVRKSLGLNAKMKKPLEPIEHAYSHFRVTLQPWLCECENATQGKPSNAKWVLYNGLKKHAFSTAFRKIARGVMHFCAQNKK